MKFLKHLVSFQPLFLILVSSQGLLHAQAAPSPVAQAASVLSQRFETVASTNSEYLLHFVRQPENDSLNMLRAPFTDFFGGLGVLGPSSEKMVEEGYQTIIVGVQDFRAPKSYGLTRSEKCYVGLSQNTGRPDLSSVFSSTKIDSVAGLLTWEWEVTPAQESADSVATPWFASQVDDATMLMCSDKKAFLEIAIALRDRTTARGFTNNLPYLFQSSYWIARSVRHEGAVDASAARQDDLLSARTLTLVADIQKRLVTVSVEGVKPGRLTKIFSSDLAEKLTSTNSTNWSMQLPLGKDDGQLRDAIELLEAFGFGLYI